MTLEGILVAGYLVSTPPGKHTPPASSASLTLVRYVEKIQHQVQQTGL